MARRRRRKIIPPAGQSAPESAPEQPKAAPKRKVVDALKADPDFFKDPLVGTMLGKCKIEKYIGEGKTSVVYRAHYLPLKRTVAVKVLLEKMAKLPAVLRVFQREGRAVAALDHENVLKIYDVGEDQEKHYLVLELLRGQELRKLIDEVEPGEFDLGEALDYTRQAALGLAAAHRKNLIHRDIKPQNLVIEPDGTLKIVDFGLAAEAEGAFAGGKLGTPHYMSPEQCRGELAETASDVYALGITLFHMLVGYAPYKGAMTTDEIIAKHIEGRRLEPEKLRKGLPGSVCELIRRMTRTSAQQRPTAGEVAEAIDRLLKGGGVKVRKRGGSARRRQAAAPASNNTPILIGVGAIVLLGLVGFLMMGGDPPPEEEEPEPVVAQQPPVKKTTPKKKPAKKQSVQLGDDEVLNQLFADAQHEEKTGNFMEALHLYKRVMDKSKPESVYYKAAKAARDEVKKARIAEKTGRRTKRITLKGSELAGQKFEEKLPDFKKRLTHFQVDPVRKELEEMLAKTRKETPERRRIERMLDEMGYIADLIGIAEGRVAGLGGGKEKWELYEFKAEPGWIVLGADQSGVMLRNNDTDTEQTRPWSQLSSEAAISLLDAVRAPTSGMDALRLGYYCLLLGDDRAQDYFERAAKADPGLRPDIAKLLAKDETPAPGED
ncbi:MAG: serine/threonine-protein kinase [Planctomycetota bacterium]|jgi:tRNA A-37 threonylcarbamoyl transferase component Bud32